MSAATFSSIGSFLPLQLNKGLLRWPSSVEYALKSVARGPETSLVTNAVALFDCIEDIRSEIGDLRPLPLKIGVGIENLLDEVDDVQDFFRSTLPTIAKLALQLPDLLEHHEKEVGKLQTVPVPVEMTLRVLSPQKPGMVILHQHFIAALLACAFFCLYPDRKERWKMGLVNINFDGLYLGVAHGIKSSVQKLFCLVHYFKKVGGNMPQGTVSFERKVLSYESDGKFWGDSKQPLCGIKVVERGAIEDAGSDYLQVDFANQQLGGGVLHTGCVQEEIRFVISPECLAGILFVSTMADYESIEITGAETYSEYTGYGPNFCFAGDHRDNTPRDSLGRRKTCIGAIDALCRPGESQFKDEFMLRELNKAYCGFCNHSSLCGITGERSSPMQISQGSGPFEMEVDYDVRLRTENVSLETVRDDNSCVLHEKLIGVATGNWGAGAFGGNLHLKSLLQWLAASQAGCEMLLYYSFSDSRSQRLQEVIDWIQKEEWGVSELWSVLQQYGHCRTKGQVHSELFEWILPI